ncbi:hypothetical protein F5887DRAFT_1260894 [Amanita rubescens]|nr:hypothetical protein F5887DRAFT_1260894 [Amanita rubescens]
MSRRLNFKLAPEGSRGEQAQKKTVSLSRNATGSTWTSKQVDLEQTIQLQSRDITGRFVVQQTTKTVKTLSSSLEDDKGGFIPNVSPFKIVLKDYFKPLKHIHRDLDDEASIAVAGRYEDSISNDETTIWLRLTVQRTAGLFTRIIFKVKLPDPCNSDLEVTMVHPLDDTPLNKAVDVAIETERSAGANLDVKPPPPVPIGFGANRAKRHKLSYTLPKFPTCSAGSHTSGDEEVCKWVLLGEENFTYGVVGSIALMGITLKLPQDLGPRRVQASFQFQFDYIQTDRKWLQKLLTSPKHSDVFPSPGEYRIVTFDLGSRKCEDKERR